MAKSSEAQAKTKGSRGRAGRDEEPLDISSLGFVLTDAASRDDLYALPRRQSDQRSASRPSTGGGHPHRAEMDHRRGSSDGSRPGGSLNNWVQSQPHTEQQTLHDPRLQQFSIGMALGSPSHPPWATHQRNGTPTSDISVPASTPSGSFSSVPFDPFADEHKQKGRWKMFGGIFSRKGSSHPTTPASPFYSVVTDLRNQPPILTPQPSTKPSVSRDNGHHHNWSPDHSSAPNSAGKQSSDDQRLPKSKPLMPRAHTSPYGPPSIQSPMPPPKDQFPPGPKRSISAAPLLQVDIPDVAMERYSVMFGSVLGKPRSSIMVRRQQQLEKLKVVDDFPSEETDEGQELLLPLRRATLPSPAKSPSYSLFPQTHQPERKPSPLSSTVRPPPTPLQRSNTAPAVSPGRATFEMIKPKSEHSRVVFTIDSPSPSTESPETPAGAPWASDISHTSTSTTPLDGGEVSPRDPEDIIIKLEAPINSSVLKDSTSMPHLRRDISPPRRPETRPQKSPITVDLRSKYNTTPLTSPYPGRHSSLNKPLPSPQAAIEQEARDARQQGRNQSLPVAQVRTVDIKGPRKGSLPTRPSPSLEPRFSRKTSLQATAASNVRSPPLKSQEHLLHEHEGPHRQQSPPRSQPQSRRQPSPSRSQGQAKAQPAPVTKPLHVPQTSSSASKSAFQSSLPSNVSSSSSSSPTAQPVHASKSNHQNPLKSSPATAAEISIARQISISRRQQMMVPIIPKTARQPQQATLVVPGEDDEGKGKGHGHVARKSQHGLLETI